MPSSLTRIPQRRRRTTLSCYECHRRKVRCDRKEPCTRCITSKLHCVYGTGRLSSDASPRSLSGSTSHAHPSSETPNDRDEHQQPPATAISSDAIARSLSPGNENGNNFSLERRVTASAARSPEIRPQKLEKILESGSRIQDINQSVTGKFSDFRGPPDTSLSPPGRAIINKTRVFGQSHWMNAASDLQFFTRSLIVPSATGSIDADFISTQKEASALLHKCKALAREIKQARPGKVYNTLMDDSSQQLPRDVADQAINIYMSCFESVTRILHIPTLRNEYEQYFINVDNVCKATQLKIRLCLAIGSSLLYDHEGKFDTRSIARMTISAAQHWLSAPFEKDRLNICGIQIQCLLLLARQIFSVGGDLIWVSVGALMHSAIQIGLNRDPEHFPKSSQLQIEIRRRLWATIIELSLQGSLDAGAFPLIHLEDFDTIAPTNVNDEDLSEAGDTIPSHPDSEPSDTSLQRIMLMSFPLRLQILRSMNSPKPHMSHERAMLIATELKKFCQELQISIHPRDEMYQFKHNMADFFLRRFLLNLHHPFASQARQIPQYHYSRKICLDTAMAILSPPQNEEFSRLVLVGGGCFKIRLRHIGLALGSELMSDIHDNGSLHTAYREMLLHALNQVREDTLIRTEFGDTSARLNLILSMVITRAELTTTDEHFELKMVKSAKTALEKSFNILKTQSGSSTAPASEPYSMDVPTDLLPEFDMDFNDFLQLANWNPGIATGT